MKPRTVLESLAALSAEVLEEKPHTKSAQDNIHLATGFLNLLKSFWFWWLLLLISCFLALYWAFVKHHLGVVMVVIGVGGLVILEWKHHRKKTA